MNRKLLGATIAAAAMLFVSTFASGQQLVVTDHAGKVLERPLKVGEYAWISIDGLLDSDAATFWPNPALDFGPKAPDGVVWKFWRGRALFWVAKSGEYDVAAVVSRVTIDFEAKTHTNLLITLSQALVVEGDDQPDPPDPPDPPVPGEKWRVLILHEAADLTKATMPNLRILAGSAFLDRIAQTDHVLLGRWDRDTASSDGSWGEYEEWKTATTGEPLPLIAIAPIGGGTIKVFPIPPSADPDWVFSLLENGGPKK